MPIINLTNPSTVPIPLASTYNDTGWSVSGGVATHVSCNAGYVLNPGIVFIPGGYYQVKYTVSGWIGGTIQASIGTNAGTINSGNGIFIDNLVAGGNLPQLAFYSQGDLSVSLVSVVIPNYVSNFNTLGFNETNNRWTSFYSFDPEFMSDFNQFLFTFKGGSLYIHESSSVPSNNFYGNQFSSQVTAGVTGEDKGSDNKLFFTLKVDCDGIWYAPTIAVPADDMYVIGQQSALLSGQMKIKEGNYWADFLRDMLDPSFSSQLQAIFSGRPMRGQVMLLTLQSDAITQTRLRGAYVYFTISERNT